MSTAAFTTSEHMKIVKKYISKPVFKISTWAEHRHSAKIKREDSMTKFYPRD